MIFNIFFFLSFSPPFFILSGKEITWRTKRKTKKKRINKEMAKNGNYPSTRKDTHGISYLVIRPNHELTFNKKEIHEVTIQHEHIVMRSAFAYLQPHAVVGGTDNAAASGFYSFDCGSSFHEKSVGRTCQSSCPTVH